MQKTAVGSKMVKDLTNGSVVKLLLAFAFPLFISNALQAVYNLVDMIIVGQYIGGTGMSAVSTGGDVLHLLTFVAMGFSSAGQVIIARDVGAGNNEGIKRTIGTMFTFLLGISLVISVICYFLKDNILGWVNTPELAWDYTMDYTVTCIFGLFFIYGYNIVSAILRGMGDSRRPFVFIAIAAVLNMVLDIVFVCYMDMAVFGAALATVIGQGVSFVVSVVYLYIKREDFGFDFKLKSFKMDISALKRLVALGVPMAIQSAAVSFSKIVLMAWINISGVTYSALAGIYNKLGMMAGIVSNSFTTAGSSMIGQNLGAKKYERVTSIMLTVFISGLSITVIAMLAVLLFNEPIFRLFTGDETVLSVAGILVAPVIINFFGCATRSVAFSIINGSGNTRLNLAVALIDGIISRIGIAALLGYAFKMGCRGFWFGDALAGFVPIIIGMSFYISGRWKREKA